MPILRCPLPRSHVQTCTATAAAAHIVAHRGRTFRRRYCTKGMNVAPTPVRAPKARRAARAPSENWWGPSRSGCHVVFPDGQTKPTCDCNKCGKHRQTFQPRSTAVCAPCPPRAAGQSDQRGDDSGEPQQNAWVHAHGSTADRAIGGGV